mgnify:CR=1 FL=1
MKLFIAILGVVLLLVWAGIRIVAGIQFDQQCEGYLKRAADANTVELARVELARAVAYAQQNQLTTGYTSIIYRTPGEDVGFWYANLAASLLELESVGPDATQLERSNVLMKLRETLLDGGDHGPSVTIPTGISVFPRNSQYALFGTLALLLMSGGIVALVIEDGTW